ncbi:glycerol-3-phosphate responsive antiterminator [Bacillaceae bacterium S4-13-56]
MEIFNQKIIPAIRTVRELEKIFDTNYEYAVFLDLHIAQVKNVITIAKQNGKKMLLHVDMIHGLKHDEYATEFLIQEIKPDGLISTRSNVIKKAKQKNVLSIQRLFLLDQSALDKSIQLIQKTEPDYIEVLPGIIPPLIKEVKEITGKPVLAGGFIRTYSDVERALEAGASGITTSNQELWKKYE